MSVNMMYVLGELIHISNSLLLRMQQGLFTPLHLKVPCGHSCQSESAEIFKFMYRDFITDPPSTLYT